MTFLDALRAAVGGAHVVVDPDVRASHEVDWTRRFQGECLAVVRPADVAETAEVVRACAAHGVVVVPQGGNTGLVGGAVPGPGSVVLSTRRMKAIRELDTAAGQVTAEAGVTLAALEEAVRGTGWDVGVDLGARAEATLGGMAATNAGGTRVLRYGTMRANVLGVEAVLADGSVISHLDGLLKDNTGYDLAGLLCGSEGTLAVVTALRMRLVPAWPDRLGVAIACGGWADAVSLAARARREVDGLDGLEAYDAAGARLAATELGVAVPLPDAPVTLCVVWAGRGDPPAALGDLVGERANVVGEPRRVLEVRERQTEAISRSGIPHKFDVTLPVARLAAFTDAVHRCLDGVAALYLFGHLGDGNLHVNAVGPAPDDDSVDQTVLTLVADHGGSVSAEHGIGRAKARWLHLSRSPAEIAAMRAVKRALDPAGLLNPGVLLPPT